jgi:hypothetical protein
MGSQFNVAKAEKGGPCPMKVNELLNWCTECKEIFTWTECGNLNISGILRSIKRVKKLRSIRW